MALRVSLAYMVKAPEMTMERDCCPSVVLSTSEYLAPSTKGRISIDGPGMAEMVPQEKNLTTSLLAEDGMPPVNAVSKGVLSLVTQIKNRESPPKQKLNIHKLKDPEIQ